MTTCDVDQACFGQNKYHPGQPTSFRYGCFNFEMCRVLMKTAFDDLARCENGGDSCGTDNSGVCNVCCRGGGCNYGDCHVIRNQLYDQYKNNGVFDLDTLESKSGGTTQSPGGK
ncbi:hypothetical protein MAR_034114 [Mya arenaria]|uniref:Uncharacterized protein n=2 Tax=Mya arenaria TaxID=6604 RepID=A0ABY7GDY7_MYAAR|nr:hypothetical protein MAR_034114 [Mya arenaria]